MFLTDCLFFFFFLIVVVVVVVVVGNPGSAEDSIHFSHVAFRDNKVDHIIFLRGGPFRFHFLS